MDIDCVELDQTEMTSAKATDVRSQTNWPFKASQIQFSRLSVSAQHKLQHFCYIFVLLVPQHIHLIQHLILAFRRQLIKYIPLLLLYSYNITMNQHKTIIFLFREIKDLFDQAV